VKQFVKPADGLKVRDPKSGQHLPAGGAEIDLGPYWHRRLRDGDVVKAAKPKAAKSAKAEKE